jgi:hypothetical protein
MPSLSRGHLLITYSSRLAFRNRLFGRAHFLLCEKQVAGYIDIGGVGEGVGLGVVSGAGVGSVAGVGAGVGVGVAVGGGFTGDELAGVVGRVGVFDGATSVPAACRTAARNFSADCGGGTEPVRMVLKSIWRP